MLEKEYLMLSTGDIRHANIIHVPEQDIYYESYLVMEMELGLETLSSY